MPATYGDGKICHIEMPATDVRRSADFYRDVFGWQICTRGDGSVAFDDGVGEVSGTCGGSTARRASPACWSTSWWTAWPRRATRRWRTVARWRAGQFFRARLG